MVILLQTKFDMTTNTITLHAFITDGALDLGVNFTYLFLLSAKRK